MDSYLSRFEKNIVAKNGIGVYLPRIKVHYLRVEHLRCMIGCRWRMQPITITKLKGALLRVLT